jgi:hypothetical protein
MRPKLWTVAPLFFAILSCDVTGPGLSHSVATLLCGPADAPATVILLARDPIKSLNPSYPSVTIWIWHGVDSLAGHTYQIGDGSGDVGAQFFRTPYQPVQASAGSVQIDRVGADLTIEGHADLRFPPRAVAEEFSAAWVQTPVVCP